MNALKDKLDKLEKTEGLDTKEKIKAQLKYLFLSSPYNSLESFLLGNGIHNTDRIYRDIPNFEYELNNWIKEWRVEKERHQAEAFDYFNLVMSTYKLSVLNKFELAARLNEIVFEISFKEEVSPSDLQRITIALERIQKLEIEAKNELLRISGKSVDNRDYKDNQKHVKALFKQLREELAE